MRPVGTLSKVETHRREVAKPPAKWGESIVMNQTRSRTRSEGSEEKRYTFCRICEASCGLEISMKDGEITQIRPDPNHVATDGFSCVKGLKQHRIFASEDRLKYPMKRVGDGFERISWEQALEEIGAKLRQLRGDHSPDSIAMYVGTAAGFSVLHPVFAQGFMTGLGSASMYASATQDCSNKFAVANLVYGFPFTQPFPDLEHINCLIVAGANPVISKWSFGQVSNPAKKLKAMEKRGGKLYFLDPRKTESAKVAGEHVFIRPSTDVFFFLSFLHEVILMDAVDHERVKAFMNGYESLVELVKPWSPERTESVTKVPADTLRAMVKDYVNADGAALYCSTGVNMGRHGAMAFWLQECINAITGNLDKRGGSLVGRGVIDFPKFGKKNGILVRSERSRVGDFPSVNDAFPGGLLADEILTPGPKQVRSLFVTGGNPLITMPNSNRLREALRKLELLVVLDILPTETAAEAHYILPCTSPLQRPDLPFIFPLMLGLQTKPHLQATRRVLPPEGEQRDEASIYLQLCKAAGAPLFGSRIAQWMLQGMQRVRSWFVRDEQPGVPQEWLLSFLLRITGQGSFKKLLKETHGRERPGHKADDFLGKRVYTDSSKVELAPPSLLEAAEKLEAEFSLELENPQELRLITKRAVTTHNSWTHNFDEFVRGERATNYLYMHPKDAERTGVSDGDVVDVSSETGTVRVPIKTLDELMEGTVALPHGWGHQNAKGLSVASQTHGVNANILAADGPENLDRLSGMAHLTGIPVSVSPAEGPQNTKDWSGL